MQEIGKDFMKLTRFQYLAKAPQTEGYPQPPLQKDPDDALEVIELPDPNTVHVKDINLRRAIEHRTSVRSYSDKPLTLNELSYLLWCTQGVKETIENVVTFRTVPSAGARHALETYLLINNVQGLEPGLYRFLAIGHKLLQLDIETDMAKEITEACLGQDFVKKSAVTFIWTAVVSRMKWRYGERGYRYLHLDAGHVCQNLYLSAEAIDCGVCAIGAFLDEDMNELLDIDGEHEFVIYIATVGKK